ncbi:MAG TPA: hypothetical protein VF913_14385 [Xanthobacteraceae bacterium]
MGKKLGSLAFGAIAFGLLMVSPSLGASERSEAKPRLSLQSGPVETTGPRAFRAAPGAQATPLNGVRYFVEFRSRTGFYGHTYVVYGQLDSRGKRAEVHYAGLYPEGGPVGFMLGHVLPVPARVDAVDDDLTDPVTESYLRILTAEEFAKTTAAIGRLRANTQLWNALLNNCNDFAAELAQGLGLRTPSTLLIPELFVSELREMNGS